MAVSKTLANGLLFEMGRGNINFETGSFRVLLMSAGYAFDRNTHKTYGQVLADEASGENGYDAGGKALIDDMPWSQDDAQNKALIQWQNTTWTADGGSIGPVASAVVLQWDEADPEASLIVGHIAFGQNITVTNGVSFQLQELGFDMDGGV
ncbi:hypothetical protein LZ24_02538 [Desulfobotulus alkaliphilus]|uniref:Uncharacterized protein n=1 Tax=Desulfobotulus alkaliphilus TaxID=622671 RepID=A0A562RHL1_9BACT|nr:hypothetical protein [Desulfobotulus alkaliphilus]TWI68565.1 hypothetical protein LZ24_02538 [Desulfobotulus alkaliphilus]